MGRRAPVEDWVTDPWDDPGELYQFQTERLRGNWHLPKWIVFSFFSVLVVVLLTGGALGAYVIKQVNPAGKATQPVNFTVVEGDTIDSVATRLEQQGIITNASVFRWYAGQKGDFTPVPGYYTLRPHDTMGNLLKVLRTPPEQTYERVPFPEGFTLAQMGLRLQNRVPRLTAAAFTRAATGGTIRSAYSPEGQPSLEGLLFPDTYQVAGYETEADVVRRMVKQMDRVGSQAGLDKAPEKVGVSAYQALIVASLVEREAKVSGDRALIARVIYNRLYLGMPLQIDASLYYNQDSETPFDTLRNLDTPYNTYLHTGLPPTPIANPGRAAIAAAMSPAPNPKPADCPNKKPCAWLYYVLASPDGSHAFATNLQDHERNIAKARAAGVIP